MDDSVLEVVDELAVTFCATSQMFADFLRLNCVFSILLDVSVLEVLDESTVTLQLRLFS